MRTTRISARAVIALVAVTVVTACHDATAPASPPATAHAAATPPAFDTGDTLTTTCLSGHTLINGVCGS